MARLAEWSTGNPRNNIKSILEYIIALLDEQVGSLQSELYEPSMVERFGSLMRDAWPAARRRTEKAFQQLETVSTASLEDHGLVGPELELKFRLLGYFSSRFADTPSEGLLKTLLDWINKILPSIFGALGGQTYLDEIKKCLEMLVRGMSK